MVHSDEASVSKACSGRVGNVVNCDELSVPHCSAGLVQAIGSSKSGPPSAPPRAERAMVAST
eukprot:CAMPEP_0195131762 /NCGR_PEP_ID=MMETSP0448-20130528/145692_1 /TAXON_ID=66468 /ORGANISM="Heterocapsa triquestra, Strain CCMP 448" /LENGTH=61 /DNA_ID=CAMNT_0040169737 /DNA_START=78 /DNA_END=259 /DNA_ORIENTATION=+